MNDFAAELEKTVRETIERKESLDFDQKLKQKSQEPTVRRFTAPSSSKKSSRSKKRKAVTSQIPIPTKRAKPIPTSPIETITCLKSIKRVRAHSIAPHREGRLFLPENDDGSVAIWVKGIELEASGIYAFETSGKLVLHLYATLEMKEDFSLGVSGEVSTIKF
jgi:hypothetical protein